MNSGGNMKEKIMAMEKYAEEENVPIIEKKSIAFIMKYIEENNIKNILEIGSAIGYSAILMASAKENVYFSKETGSSPFEESEGAPTKSNVLIFEK